MIPKGLETKNIDIKTQPSASYKMALDYDFIVGKCDGIDAVRQAVYKILNTQRYQYLIYSRCCGVEFKDIFGKPVSEAVGIIPERIKNALTQDDRITDVDGFVFDTSKRHIVYVEFTVHTIFGNFRAVKELDI